MSLKGASKKETLPSFIASNDLKDDPENPPLISLKVTNPVTYLKLWWKKVMDGEGVDVRFTIHPLTAIALTIILLAGGASIGWISNSVLTKVPVVKDFIPTPTPVVTPDPWRETAYTGILRKVGDGKYYLQTGDGEAVTLSIPVNVTLEKYIGKRIFASGKYNKVEEVLLVTDASDLEFVIQSTAIPTLPPAATE